MFRNSVLLGVAACLLVSACGSDDTAGDTATGTPADAPTEVPTIVVTTSILGDVVREVVGSLAQVSVIMPNGASPHDFEPSAQQIAELRAAGVLVVNGADFEEGMLDAIASATADGVATFEAISAVEPLEFEAGAHDEHAAEGEHDEHAAEGEPDEHAAEGEHDEHAAEGEHDEHSGTDPHFFTDPRRMAVVVESLVAFLTAELPELPAADLAAQGAAYVEELDALDTEVEELLAAVPADQRKLLTNHEVFGYFADRYGFEVIGTVIPGGSTQGEPDAATLAELVEIIEAEGVPAIFADTSSPEQLAETLAAEVGGVEVVELFSESLGDADSDAATYLEMVRTNAGRIAEALAT